MEKISINQSKKFYNIVSISSVADNLIKITFKDKIPSTFGTINLYTIGGYKAATITGFDTIYKTEDKTVYLSNDGSVYHEPDPVTPPEPYVPTVEEVFLSTRTGKISEVNTACTKAITDGISVTLSDGTVQHFTLKSEDQIAMLLCASKVVSGADAIPWHPNGDQTMPCVFYSNSDMALITQAAEFHISYHQTYCNSLKVWIEACQTTEELQEIFYGADVPEQYRSEVLNTYLNKLTEMAGA